MKYLLILLLLLSFLFFSSSQTYEEQSLIGLLHYWLPNRPLESILSLIKIPYWGRIVSVEERGYYYFIEFCLRKGAHFVLFGLVGSAFYLLLQRFRFRVPLALCCTLICACADEYHQSLTGGRTPSWQDVLLDTTGACFFITIIALIIRRRY